MIHHPYCINSIWNFWVAENRRGWSGSRSQTTPKKAILSHGKSENIFFLRFIRIKVLSHVKDSPLYIWADTLQQCLAQSGLPFHRFQEVALRFDALPRLMLKLWFSLLLICEKVKKEFLWRCQKHLKEYMKNWKRTIFKNLYHNRKLLIFCENLQSKIVFLCFFQSF